MFQATGQSNLSGPPLLSRQRVHLAAVWQDNQVSFYVDGKPHTTRSSRARGPDRTRRLFLGGQLDFETESRPDFLWSGVLDEIRISQSARYVREFTPRPRFENDADTIALYHCDAGAGDVLKDDSGHGHDGKIVGAKWVRVPGSPASNVASETTSDGEFAGAGNGFLRFDGSPAYVKIPTLAIDGGQPLTIEMQLRPRLTRQDLQAILTFGGTGRVGVSVRETGFPVFSFLGGTGRGNPLDGIAVDRPLHFAFVWNGQDVRVFAAGKRGDAPGPTSVRSTKPPPSWIGLPPASEMLFPPDIGGYEGDIDEIRVSRIDRYQSNFTPPASGDRFEMDEHTLALYHCDAGSGDVLKDDSGHGHDGQIVGAKWVRVDGEGVASPPLSAVVPPSEPDYALRFDGSSHVTLPSWTMAAASPYTLECFVTPPAAGFSATGAGYVITARNDLTLTCVPAQGQVLWALRHGPSGRPSAASPATDFRERVHVAGVFTGTQVQITLPGGWPAADQPPRSSRPI
jgi:hypothetical protein